MHIHNHSHQTGKTHPTCTLHYTQPNFPCSSTKLWMNPSGVRKLRTQQESTFGKNIFTHLCFCKGVQRCISPHHGSKECLFECLKPSCQAHSSLAILLRPICQLQNGCWLNIFFLTPFSVNSRAFLCENPRISSFWNAQTRPSGTNNHITVKARRAHFGFSFWCFDMIFNWSFWPGSVWYYAWSFCLMSG